MNSRQKLERIVETIVKRKLNEDFGKLFYWLKEDDAHALTSVINTLTSIRNAVKNGNDYKHSDMIMLISDLNNIHKKAKSFRSAEEAEKAGY